MYHYHGLPTGLLWTRRVAAPEKPMHLLGYAADGFPIYGAGGTSRRGRPGARHSGRERAIDCGTADAQGDQEDATTALSQEDFEYVPGLGDLDECNGRTGPTPEFPEGTYYYVPHG